MSAAALSSSAGTNSSSSLPQDERIRRCKACASSALHVDWAAGDRICTHCGLVDEERLVDDRPEWREFDDADDLVRNANSGGGGAARCGLVATNEQLWIGGLQPTTLSRHVFGQPTSTSLKTRKRLFMANERMDRWMEKKHKRDIDNAKVSLQIRDRKRRQRREDGSDDLLNMNDEDGREEMDDVRPELEQLLVQEEETALATTAALYADKWSLDRAVSLFGTGHEVESLGMTTAGAGQQQQQLVEDKKLSETLTRAAQDLYQAYSMLNASARSLHLPERVIQEATAILVKYAARRDGLSVRGVASQFKKKHQPHSLGKRQARPQAEAEAQVAAEEEEARQALREYNKLKQIGSIVAAILFYTSRNLNFPRSLAQVCGSVETPSSIRNNSHLEISSYNNNNNNDDKNELSSSFIKKKHCSKAMTEIKQVFPDMTRNNAAGGAAGRQQALLVNDNASAYSTESVVEHVLQKIRLPPVAQASVKTLARWMEEHDPEVSSSLLDTKKRLVLCAALTCFVCCVGTIMQNLAKQASASSTARPSVTARRNKKKTQRPILLEGKSNTASNEKEEEEKMEGAAMLDEFSEEEAREHKAYEMRRVWDAWKDQTPWSRTPSEIERASGVSMSMIEAFFKASIFPKRGQLLTALRDKSKIALSLSSSSSSSPLSSLDDSPLSRVPLASVLLPHVEATEPLITERIT